MINAEFNESINDLTTENLYQWDSYQTLRITGIDFGSVTPKVHFANKKSVEALAVQGVLKNDGRSCEVSIPNTLLREKYDIVAYIYTNTGLTYKTIKSITIPIVPRLKPTNYTQPSNEEIAEIEEIELQAKGIIDALTASEYDPRESYKRPNIVYYNHNAYMCMSAVEISGIVPTYTTKWQEIVHGEAITGITVNNSGKLTFTTSSGNSYDIDFQTENVELADDEDVPALKFTKQEVTGLKDILPKTENLLDCVGKKVTGRATLPPVITTDEDPIGFCDFQITKPGVYIISAKLIHVGNSTPPDGNIENTTYVFSVSDINKDVTVNDHNGKNIGTYISKGRVLRVSGIYHEGDVRVRMIIPYEV